MSAHIIATITPKSEHATDVEKQLRHMVEVTRKEPGNHRYDLFRETSPSGPVLHLYEIYEDRNAFDSHLASEHFQTFRSTVADWLAEPPQVRVLEALDVEPER